MHNDDLEWAIVGLHELAELCRDLRVQLEIAEEATIIDYDDEAEVAALQRFADDCEQRRDERVQLIEAKISNPEDEWALNGLDQLADEWSRLRDRLAQAEANPRRTVLVRKARIGWFVERYWCPNRGSLERRIPKARKRRYRPGTEELAVPPKPDWEAEDAANGPKVEYGEDLWALAGLHRIEEEIRDLQKRISRAEAVPRQIVVVRRARLGGWIVEGHWRPTRRSMEQFIPRAFVLRYRHQAVPDER